jgi:hypothetical protein
MKGRVIGYWIATALIALVMLGGGIADFLLLPDVVKGAQHLGYPEYFFKWLGVAKVLGTLALLQPWLGKLKEWAYAGFTFDLIGASVSHASVGDPIGNIMGPLVFLAILGASYFLRRPAPAGAAQAAVAT